MLTLPRVADSLAGQMETIHILPLARAEIAGKAPTFLERLFTRELKSEPEAISRHVPVPAGGGIAAEGHCGQVRSCRVRQRRFNDSACETAANAG